MTSNIISNLSLRNYFLHLLSQIPDNLKPNNLRVDFKTEYQISIHIT